MIEKHIWEVQSYTDLNNIFRTMLKTENPWYCFVEQINEKIYEQHYLYP